MPESEDEQRQRKRAEQAEKNHIQRMRLAKSSELLSSTELLENMKKSTDSMEEILKDSKKKQKKYFKKSDGHGLRIMTPNQLLTRLPILLAQKNADNNSQKLNNEIR